MADKRLATLERIPTLRERGLDVTIDVWRGMAVAKDSPKEVVDALRVLASKVMKDPRLQDILRTQNLSAAYLDGPEFARELNRQSDWFRQTIPLLDLRS